MPGISKRMSSGAVVTTESRGASAWSAILGCLCCDLGEQLEVASAKRLLVMIARWNEWVVMAVNVSRLQYVSPPVHIQQSETYYN
jgi:hypothetical protein